MCSGIGFEVNPSTTLILGYRYFATTDPEFEAVLAFPALLLKLQLKATIFVWVLGLCFNPVKI